MNIYQNHNPIFFNELSELYLKTKGIGLSNYLKHSKKYLKDWIDSELLLLQDPIYNIITKCYWILNGLTDFPKCQICGKNDNYQKKNLKINIGYLKTCSKKCGHELQKSKVSLILNGKSDEEKKQIIEKRIKTCLKKYGYENPMQDKNILKKAKLSRLNKNSGKYFSQESINKAKKIKIEKYGNANNYLKIKKTVFLKYGVQNISQDKSIKEKIKNTCLKRYNVKSIFESKEIKEKIKNTCFQKYGVDNVLKLNKFHEKSALNKKIKSYNNFILNCEFDEPLFTLEEYLSRKSDQELFEFRCKKCGKIFKTNHEDGEHKHCEYCYPSLISQFTSNEEKQLINFLKNDCHINNFLQNSKKIINPFELDIYIPDKKLAIEFDGLYWHNDKNKSDQKYHLNKTELCEKQGIQLIHIFENEWIYKQDIVKSRIKNLLGIYDRVVFARKCYIEEVDSKISKEFQDKNHIQGAVNAKINLGLFYEEKLISIMTFGKPRFDKNHDWELLRFCTELGYHIPGSASKLLKYFERNYKPKSLISYADRRWSQGKLYKALGFQLDHISKPNYWYVIGNQLKSRINFQKFKLKNILKNYNESLSEIENMKNNGYFRIFDCGNIVFEKIF